MIVVTASRVNETSSPEPSVTPSPSVSSAVLPCSATSTSMPLSSSQSWRSASSALASSTMPGHAVGEPRRPGRRSGRRGPRRCPPATTISARNTHSTATPRGKRARWSITTNGFSSSATSAATMKISATGPARLDQQEGADDRQRQDDRLDPPRHHDRLDRRRAWHPAAARPDRPALGVGGGSLDAACADGSDDPPYPKYARRADGATSVCALTAILFVGDVVGSAGRRARPRACSATCARSCAPTSSWSTARTRRAGSASRPSTPTSSSAGADVDHARQPHLPPPRGLALPRGAPRHHPAGQLPRDAARAAGRRSSSATA